MLERIVIYPAYFARHMSHLLAGTIAYCNTHGVPLHYDLPSEEIITAQQKGAVTIVKCEYRDAEPIHICFDMADWPDIASMGALDFCDVYVKRSYSQPLLHALPSHYQAKIIPYGFYFACSQASLIGEFRAALANWRAGFVRSWGSPMGSALTELFRWVARAVIKRSSAFIPLSRLESISGGELMVFYHTRVWDPSGHKSSASKTLEELNETRISLVRKLKQELPDHFLGGITPSDYARRVCPELITPFGSDVNSYLELMAKAKIVITEEGLHGSTGSRLGEYFAAGRCVVSEALVYDVPRAPVNKQDWHEYHTVDECVEICKSLLNDANKVEQTIANARRYYSDWASPERTIGWVLEQAAELCHRLRLSTATASGRD